jgi:hypothetical protein
MLPEFALWLLAALGIGIAIMWLLLPLAVFGIKSHRADKGRPRRGPLAESKATDATAAGKGHLPDSGSSPSAVPSTVAASDPPPDQ